MAQVRVIEETTPTNFFSQLYSLQQVNWSIGKLEVNLDEMLSMTSTSDLCPEEAEERATLLETRTMTMKVHSMLVELVSDLDQFLRSNLSIRLAFSVPKIIQTLQLTNKHFFSFIEKYEDNGREDHKNETEKLGNTRDLLNENLRLLNVHYKSLQLLNVLRENSSEMRPSFDHALQFLFNAISSRTRALCRVHLLFDDRIDHTKIPNESFLRLIFSDARIKYVKIDEINW